MATRSWNRVELIGNLTRDPEMRYTPSGAAVVTFTVATNRTYVSEGERREEADFHRCVAWNKLAELCQQLLKKGNRVFVSGRLQNRSWDTPEGQNRQITEIVIEDMLLLTSRNNGEELTEDLTPVPAQIPPKPAPKVAVIADGTSTDAKPAPIKTEEEKPQTEDPGNLDDLPF